MDYFDVKFSRGELGSMSSLALAHVGDAVYELMARTYLASVGVATAAHLHRETIKMVAAPAQAAAAERMLGRFTEEEADVFRRGRNAKVHAVPSASTEGQYHEATALEALFGWLWLQGRKQRLSELFAAAEEGYHAS